MFCDGLALNVARCLDQDDWSDDDKNTGHSEVGRCNRHENGIACILCFVYAVATNATK